MRKSNVRVTPRVTLFLILTIAIGKLQLNFNLIDLQFSFLSYLECDSEGNTQVKVCDEGKSLNLVLGVCQDDQSVDCLTRTKKWKIVPSKTKKIRLFGRLSSISSTPSPTTEVTTTTSSPSTTLAPLAVVEDSVVHHDPLLEAQCEADGGVYVVPDPLHCDRYLLCPGKTVELCEAGAGLDTNTAYCAPLAGVQCGDRTLNMRNIQVGPELR